MLKVLLVVAILAVAVYTIVRLLQGRGDPGRSAAQPPRPVAPDDDAEFLRGLDRRRHPRDDSDS